MCISISASVEISATNTFNMIGQNLTIAVLTEKESVNFDIVYNIENVTGTGYTDKCFHLQQHLLRQLHFQPLL